jgi:hypothetical protein
MTHEGTIKWPGQSGAEYTYWIYRIGTTFQSEPGNYIFAKETNPNTFKPIYIGQTGDLSERFENHHKLPSITRNGATHIHVHKNLGGERQRLAEELDLVHRWCPTCND